MISKSNFTGSSSVFVKPTSFVEPTSARPHAWGAGLRPLPDRSFEQLFQAVDDERAIVPRHALVNASECRRVVVRCHAAEARRDGDILLAADGVADDPALMAGAVAVVPQLGPGFGIVGMNGAAPVRRKHQIARGRQHAGQ